MSFDSIVLSDIVFSIIKIAGYILIFVGWVLVLSLLFSAYQLRRRRLWLSTQKYITLLIQVPKNNEKTPLAAELLFAALHGIHKPKEELSREGSFQEHVSFEIVSQERFIRFYVHLPAHLRDFVEGQVYAQYPTVEVSEVDDYSSNFNTQNNHFLGSELKLTRPYYYPIKTFVNFEVDPLASITAVISKLDPDEQIWAQIICRPVDDRWQSKSLIHIASLRSGSTFGSGSIFKMVLFGVFTFLGDLIKTALTGPTKDAIKKPEEKRLSGTTETAIKAIEQKASKLGYEVKIRLVLVSNKDPMVIKTKLQSIVGSFKQFTAPNINGFMGTRTTPDNQEFLDKYRARAFDDNGYILNIEELGTIFHMPNITVETPNIVWAGSKKGEPPSNLPIEGSCPADELTLFGATDFRHAKYRFGIKDDDRKKHLYVIGKTGVGKSTLLENMAMNDMLSGKGFAFIDPHGESINRILDAMPPERTNDVIYFNPGDRENPIAFNPLETVEPDLRSNVASGVVGIFKKIFGNSWGPRMEYILRYAILALLDAPDSTMMGILKILVDKKYRDDVLKYVSDPVVREFWNTEFAAYDKKFATEAIAPIQNKVGQFLATPTIRNIIAQPISSFDIREAMDSGKIILVKLSKGEIGEDNMTLLGGMIVTKIQQAAMSRIDLAEADRRDFYLYVDEFQNFATESFATIFSEARKYGLSLTVANQYMAQIIEEVRNAVIGNVGTIISFRVGANDAPLLKKEFEPVFDEQDLVNLNKFHIYLKLSIDGITTPAFSALTLPPITGITHGHMETVIRASRERYTKPRSLVEQKINEWSERFETPTGQEKRDNKPADQTVPAAPAQVQLPPGYRKIFDTSGKRWYWLEQGKEIIKTTQTQELAKPPVMLKANLPGGPQTPSNSQKAPEQTLQPTMPQGAVQALKTSDKSVMELKPGEFIDINKST